MLAPLAAAASVFAAGPVDVLYEVPTRDSGVPDLVLARPDREFLQERHGAGTVTDIAALAVLLAFRGVTIDGCDTQTLAERVGIRPRRLRIQVLPWLEEHGHVESLGCDHWKPAYRRRSPLELLVTIEAKLRDWRRGLAQAIRHKSTADFSYLALDAGAAARAVSEVVLFERFGIGLGVINAEGESSIVSPAVRKPIPSLLRREHLAEQIATMLAQGLTSREPPTVFGRKLLSTTGVDPRLVGASAR